MIRFTNIGFKKSLSKFGEYIISGEEVNFENVFCVYEVMLSLKKSSDKVEPSDKSIIIYFFNEVIIRAGSFISFPPCYRKNHKHDNFI